MKLRRLETVNFRNLLENPPEFKDGINVLCGSNAAGKTNTLEAMYLFASGKSFRTRNDRDFIRRGEKTAHAAIHFDGDGISDKVQSINFMVSGQKTAKALFVENVSVDKASEFLGNFRAVLFTPDHLELIKGAPEERRRLVDVALCQIRPGFVRVLNDYAEALAQRNSYLKKIKFYSGKPDKDYLDVLNRILAETGGVVTKQRGLYCKKMEKLAGEAYAEIAGGGERLYVSYVSRSKIEDFSDEKYCSERLYASYTASTEHDLESGYTLSGPHRDDMVICIGKNGENKEIERTANGLIESDEGEGKISAFAARTFGSQGQQRSAVLAIKMAEGKIAGEKCGEAPVFLLDDLFSELDGKRRKRICGMLEGMQSVITACDKESIPNIDGISTVYVDNGRYEVKK